MTKQNITSYTSKSEYLILRFAVIFFPENTQEILSCQNSFFEQMYVIQKCYFKFKVFLYSNHACSAYSMLYYAFLTYFNFHSNSLKLYSWIADSVVGRYFSKKISNLNI